MSTVNIVFKVGKPAKIDALQLDASLSETHAGDVDLTKHPVEKGIDVSDNVQVKPETLTMEGFISNTPLPSGGNQRYTFTRNLEGKTTLTTDGATYPAGGDGPAQTAYRALKALKDNGTLVSVVTAWRSYDNMVLTSLSVPRSSTSGDGMRFSAMFEQVRIVGTKTVTLAKKTLSKVTEGNKTSKPASAGEQKRSESILHSLTKGLVHKVVQHQ